MTEIEAIIALVTKAGGRKSLYHFTRAGNLPAISQFDALWSSSRIMQDSTGERRLAAAEVHVDGYSLTVNSHLRIPESMMDAGVTLEQFRACLDQHVFLWPTIRDCRKMLDTYTRREPDAAFAVLEFDAKALLTSCSEAVKLSKYDSGSSPRFPNNCGYRKSPAMFLPLAEFGRVGSSTVPAKAAEIKEVLVEDQLRHMSRFLRAVYAANASDVPAAWQGIVKSLAAFGES
ncbi:DUF7002 family protein [Paenibacillus sp. R14(2021)]|uniref:DUF7002 family protein n=1 Tax=Paenibacillus sp. R14(2021) TaxID=2859228 RepID=UPI001C611B98|nr:hypothetical protein [Paenibacillus sp. R14(2021)]